MALARREAGAYRCIQPTSNNARDNEDKRDGAELLTCGTSFKRALFGEPLATQSDTGWVYPLPPLTRLTRVLRIALGCVLLAGSALVVVVAVLWAIPSWSAATSEEYALVAERARTHREVSQFLGSPVSCERVPSHYRFSDTKTELRFWVRGPQGQALVSAQVEGKRVTRFAVTRVRFGE